jgi:hypothetical protein
VLPIEKFVPKFGGAVDVSGDQMSLKLRPTAKRWPFDRSFSEKSGRVDGGFRKLSPSVR